MGIKKCNVGSGECTAIVEGVTVNANGQITVLNLNERSSSRSDPFRLQGSLPDFSLATALRSLQFNHQAFSGSIPSLAKNTALQSLSLAGSKLEGPVPDFSKNTALERLFLGSNKLTGSIPDFSLNTAL